MVNGIAQRRLLIMAALPCLWFALITLLSNDPNSSKTTAALVGGNLNMFVRKLAHIAEYAMLFFFLDRPLSLIELAQPELAETKVRFLTFKRIVIFMLLVILACVDEWHQSFVPGRVASLVDVSIDAIGGMLGWTASALFGVLLARRYMMHGRKMQRIFLNHSQN